MNFIDANYFCALYYNGVLGTMDSAMHQVGLCMSVTHCHWQCDAGSAREHVGPHALLLLHCRRHCGKLLMHQRMHAGTHEGACPLWRAAHWHCNSQALDASKCVTKLHLQACTAKQLVGSSAMALPSHGSAQPWLCSAMALLGHEMA
jgi:hypothetical protein